MAKPVLVVVDDDDASLQALTRELESRYGVHYQVMSGSSAEVALARLAELKAAGADVPLVLADQWMPGMSGTQLLARVRDIFPRARRGLLISWGDRSTPAPFLEAAALGWLEFYLPKPTWSPDEQFHRVVTGSLEEWWREQGGRFESITVIGDDPSARVHEIRDLLARNSVPFGFYPSDSPEGRAALRRLGVGHPAGPVLSLYTGVVLVDPANAEVAEALGLDVRLADQTYDVVIVGAGPGRPAWPPRSTRHRMGCAPPCWSGRRSAARPGRAHGSGTIWVSLTVSAAWSWRSAPTNRRGCSAPTSFTATRRLRWHKTGTCWWSGCGMEARFEPAR
jgi:thioredoxin reductase (NADPH)